MHTDIDEGAEVGDIGDSAFQNHLRLQIRYFFNARFELGGFEFWARIAAGFVQLTENVGDCGQTELFIGEFSRIQGF